MKSNLNQQVTPKAPEYFCLLVTFVVFLLVCGAIILKFKEIMDSKNQVWFV